VAQAVGYLSGTRGVPKSKIIIGTPFYGKEFTADSLYRPSTACVDVRYADIPDRISAGWRYHWDDLSQVPYLTMPSLSRTLCFDDSLSVTMKALYARDNELGGIMVWALGQDVLGTRQPLVEAIGKATQSLTSIPVAAGPAAPECIQLRPNYPNPFNPVTTIEFEVSSGPIGVTSEQWVKLTVCDVLGREVAVLVDERKESGHHNVQFDGSGFASGVYFYRLTVSNLSVQARGAARTEGRTSVVQTRSMLLLR
jgi:hypothetical protein